MCRLIVRIRDKINPDSIYDDVGCLKRGMVVDIVDDGFDLGRVGNAEAGVGDWQTVFNEENDRHGKTVHTSPGWVIVEIPGRSKDLLTGYLTEEPGDRKLERTLQRRAFFFDIDAWVSGGSQSLTLGQAIAMQRPVTKRPDPGVLPARSKVRL